MNAGGFERTAPVKLDELYQEVILDHNKKPRNFQKLDDATSYAHGVNPLCGDDFELYLVIDGGTVKKVGFQGQGCAISKASASLMTQAVEGKSVREAETLKNHFLALLTAAEPSEEHRAGTGRLKFFEGVKQFPIRVKCATLIWRALEEALKDKAARNPQVSTEDTAERKRELS
ncbi:MAG TPA: SUF system NifU family Fe-S cluster assembly protein [Candidatus Eisenbacteria bacterium]|nr:SUF system NifU family Fe-S cluster assembly protein [Candidatus Eisenbacteria bacterium]